MDYILSCQDLLKIRMKAPVKRTFSLQKPKYPRHNLSLGLCLVHSLSHGCKGKLRLRSSTQLEGFSYLRISCSCAQETKPITATIVYQPSSTMARKKSSFSRGFQGPDDIVRAPVRSCTAEWGTPKELHLRHWKIHPWQSFQHKTATLGAIHAVLPQITQVHSLPRLHMSWEGCGSTPGITNWFTCAPPGSA